MRTLNRVFCIVCILSAAPRVIHAQAADGSSRPLTAQSSRTVTGEARSANVVADSAAAAGDSLYRRGDGTGALAVYQSALRHAPDSPGLAWRAARAALAIGWNEPNETRSIHLYMEAQAYAARAVALAPADTNALLWLAAAKGRQAQVDDDPRTVVRLAREAHDVIIRLLTIDSTSAGAHNFLGQLHYQVMKTSWPKRMLALHLMGGVHFDPSWAEAETHLTRAVALDPDVILFRLELGRYYARRGTAQQAGTQLRKALMLTRRQPQDALLQREAQALLEGLR